MQALRRWMLMLAVACSAFSQTYTINTVAGGGLPVNVPGISAGIGHTSGGIAVDAGGNVFIVAQDYNIEVRRRSSISSGGAVMMLITPPIASEPYSVEPEPRSTSTC